MKPPLLWMLEHSKNILARDPATNYAETCEEIATEMLAALEECHALISDWGGHLIIERHAIADHCAAAIAKAKGE